MHEILPTIPSSDHITVDKFIFISNKKKNVIVLNLRIVFQLLIQFLIILMIMIILHSSRLWNILLSESLLYVSVLCKEDESFFYHIVEFLTALRRWTLYFLYKL